jgi:hypothetical protein
LVPNLNFGSCCNAHDVCYDTCDEWFEDCNDNFHSCMNSACRSSFGAWYEVVARVACYGAADLYYKAVSSGTAKTHFQDGSKEICDCKCADLFSAVCTKGGICEKVRGTGANDSDNCGGCGNKCGDKAHCLNAVCVCNPAAPTPDQCGNLCLDFKTHPRNCGRCGNVCASGYCYEGACFTPPADSDVCYPVGALQNGDFSNGSASWTLSDNHVPGVASTPLLGPAPATFVQLVLLSSGTVSISQTVRMCSGVQYKLDFQAYANNAATTITVTLGGQLVSSSVFTNKWYWVAQGPYTLPVFHTGDAGATQGDNHFLDVDLTISATYPSGFLNVAELSAVSMYAV